MSCGICFKDSEQKFHIWSNKEGEKSFAVILKKHLWFISSASESTLEYVCVQCWTQVNEFDKFFESIKLLHEEISKDDEISTLKTQDSLDSSITEMQNTKDDIKSEPNEIDKSFEDEYVTVLVNELDLYENENEIESIFEEQEDTELKLKVENSDLVNSDVKDIDKSKPRKKCLKNSGRKPPTRTRSTTTEDDRIVNKHISLHCELCNFRAEIFQDIVKHFESEHAGTRAFIICCGRRFSKRERVVQHAWLHEDPEHFQCPVCKRAFRDNEIKNAHMKAQHPRDEELIYACDQCEKRFARGYLLKLHKAVHVPVDEREFFCHKCPTPRAFASQNQLNIHNSMAHNRAPNICDVCGKTIRDRQAFKKHVRLHFEDSGPRVKCPHPDCESWLKDHDNLKQHLRLHKSNVESLQCDECDKLCKDRRALTCHKRTVHPAILFGCEVCSKVFKKAISLKEHMATHTGEALYECPFCTQKFKSNANMHAHKKKTHPAEWAISKNLKNR